MAGKRPVPKKKGKKNQNKMTLALVVGLLLIAGFWLSLHIGNNASVKSAKHEQGFPAKAPVEKESSPSLVETVMNPSPHRTVTSQQQLAQAGNSELGAKRDEQGQLRFTLRIKTKPVCHPGDFEAMSIVFGEQGQLLLSLEPMNATTGAAPLTRVVSLREIAAGVEFALPLDTKKAGIYGLYLCGDADKQNRCSGKKAADFNGILNGKNLAGERSSIFYYSFSFVSEEEQSAYTGGDTKGLSETHEALNSQKRKQPWQDDLAKAAKLVSGVSSFPPKLMRERESLVLELMVAKAGAEACRP